MSDLIKSTQKNLIKNGFKVKIFDSEGSAKEWLLENISIKEEIGVGGSKTLRDINIISSFKQMGNKIYDHWENGLSPEEILKIRKKQLLCDVFLTSSNAITADGQIVNREWIGNRINAMTFGPKRIFIVVGMNKIVNDLKGAIERIKKISAPLRNKNLNTKNPCVKKGECVDCNLPTRICRVTHIMHRCPSNSDITVLIIKKELGF